MVSAQIFKFLIDSFNFNFGYYKGTKRNNTNIGVSL